jgi:hypothetical protein
MIHYGMTRPLKWPSRVASRRLSPGPASTVNAILPGPSASETAGEFVESMAGRQNLSKAEIEKEFFEKVRLSSLLERSRKSAKWPPSLPWWPARRRGALRWWRDPPHFLASR